MDTELITEILFIVSPVIVCSLCFLLVLHLIGVRVVPKKRQELKKKAREIKPEVTVIHEEKDEQGRYHCLDNYAVEYSNGNKDYYIHGVKFSKDMFNTIFIKKEYTPEQILNMKNAEQKGIVIKLVGYDYILQGLQDYNILDEERVKSKVNGKELLYQVLEFNVSKDIVARIVRVQDHSTGKITCLGVPRIPQTRSSMGAIAWTFGLDTWNYEPEVET